MSTESESTKKRAQENLRASCELPCGHLRDTCEQRCACGCWCPDSVELGCWWHVRTAGVPWHEWLTHHLEWTKFRTWKNKNGNKRPGIIDDAWCFTDTKNNIEISWLPRNRSAVAPANFTPHLSTDQWPTRPQHICLRTNLSMYWRTGVAGGEPKWSWTALAAMTCNLDWLGRGWKYYYANSEWYQSQLKAPLDETGFRQKKREHTIRVCHHHASCLT